MFVVDVLGELQLSRQGTGRVREHLALPNNFMLSVLEYIGLEAGGKSSL